MSKTIYLYLKTHNKTGLKYLGKTTQNPYQYKGSGVRWLKHLEKHGDDIKTQILFETKSSEEFKKIALEYSDKLDIVKSREYANVVDETGEGGSVFPQLKETNEKRSKTLMGHEGYWKGKSQSQESNKKRSESMKNVTRSEEWKQKISKSMKGKQKSESHKEKLRENLKGKTWKLVEGKRVWMEKEK